MSQKSQNPLVEIFEFLTDPFRPLFETRRPRSIWRMILDPILIIVFFVVIFILGIWKAIELIF